ncbi:hypothetical protein GQ457_09G030950 [Hibiscus cannabinus]
MEGGKAAEQGGNDSVEGGKATEQGGNGSERVAAQGKSGKVRSATQGENGSDCGGQIATRQPEKQVQRGKRDIGGSGSGSGGQISNGFRGKQEGRVERNKHGVVSLFVENIPDAIHWKGLWHSFARHGDVVNVYIVYIVRKRFGSVRMKDKNDADRIIERLHGFKLYGSILTVKYAANSQVRKGKFVGKNKDFDIRTSSNMSNKNAEASRFESRVIREDIVWNIPCGESLKRISGHVENEKLWKLRKCLVGETATVCSVSSIHSKMLNWAMGEFKIQRLGARSFLLTIQDEDLYLMLEDLDWSYLKEIFIDIKPWSEKESYSERATWLEVKGMPLHCWNDVSLKRIAGFRGNFEPTVP